MKKSHHNVIIKRGIISSRLDAYHPCVNDGGTIFNIGLSYNKSVRIYKIFFIQIEILIKFNFWRRPRRLATRELVLFCHQPMRIQAIYIQFIGVSVENSLIVRKRKQSMLALYYWIKVFMGEIHRARKSVSILFLSIFMVVAQAALPKISYEIYRSPPAPSSSVDALCNDWPSSYPGSFSGARADPITYSQAPGHRINIYCLYTYTTSNGTSIPNDQRSVGAAFCLSPDIKVIVNPAKMTCECEKGFKYQGDVDRCVRLIEGPSRGKPSDNGPSCCQPEFGKPINPGTGNMWHIESDYVPASSASTLVLRRTYNSNPYNWDAAAVRSFGVRWTQPYDAVLKAEKIIPETQDYVVCWKREDTGVIVECTTPGLIPQILPEAVSILRGNGKRHFFKMEAGVWKGDANNSDTLTSTYNSNRTAIVQWVYQSAQGDVTERYSGSGQLVSSTARNGVVQRFTYSNGTTNDSNAGRSPADAPVCSHTQVGAPLPAGKLMCVTDSLGFKLHFEYDAKGRVVKVLDPADQPYIYEYDGASGGCASADANNAACSANNLTKVTYPDATSRTYLYNEAAQINDGKPCLGFGSLLNAWTGYIDENGDRHISWTYDCRGRATSSELADGAEKVKIAYNDDADGLHESAVVQHYTGLPSSPVTTTTTSNYGRVLGSPRNTSLDKPCIECGDYAARTYDARGNYSSLKDWRGNLSCFAYDQTRNLEMTRVEGAAGTANCTTLLTAPSLAAPMRKTSTKWHAMYRLPLQIAEPKKRTTYEYDTAGNLLTRTEQATSDETGVLGFSATLAGTPRTWKYTVNSIGQVLTITGPRTDVVDRTTFTYDTAGNLETATDALKRTTRFSNYDKHGNARRIDAPNGVSTDLEFSLRGKLLSKTMRSPGLVAATTYRYDNAGNIKQTTMPDNSTIDYTYDAAHRLTAIADSRGNRIDYVLDLTGNRVKEEVRDPNGTLARQVSRTFDTMGRMTSQTGAAQ